MTSKGQPGLWLGLAGLILGVLGLGQAVLGESGGTGTIGLIPNNTNACFGEYALCPSGECTLTDCGVCRTGEYVCPLRDSDNKTVCVRSADDYVRCPGLTGTHLDWNLTTEQRIDYLVAHTTLEEQAAQLVNTAPGLPLLGVPPYQWLNDDEHGVRQEHATIFPDGPGLGASWDRDLAWRLSPLIACPHLIEQLEEGTTGQSHPSTTNTLLFQATLIDVFVIVTRSCPLSYTHSGNRGASANGYGITLYAPNLNLVRDPRWGRAQEVYSTKSKKPHSLCPHLRNLFPPSSLEVTHSEDPRLTSVLTVGFVTGAQGMYANGTLMHERYMLTGACCKHYVAYDLENHPQERNVFDAAVNTRDFWEHYMPAFDACINEAKAMHVMCSYNALNGYPTCGDPGLLNGILRSRWNWTGFVVSDYDAWNNLYETHHFVDSRLAAAAEGINAGLDQEGGGTEVAALLPEAVAEGLTSPATVAASFRRLFRARINLGMLDPPHLNPYNSIPFSEVGSPANLALNREAARKSICMYKNQNDLLPLQAKDYTGDGSLLLVDIGAGSGLNILGNYAQPPDHGSVSLAEGVRTVLAPQAQRLGNCTTFTTGGFVNDELPGWGASSPADCCRLCFTTEACAFFSYEDKPSSMLAGTCHLYGSAAMPAPDQNRTIGQCGPAPVSPVATARGCNNIGCDSTAFFSDAVTQAQQRLVCVLVRGGGMDLTQIMSECDAVLDLWYPGDQGGLGFADVLFGATSPSGKSPQTQYSSSDELPVFGDMGLRSKSGVTYRYYEGTKVTVPFGFGLSYTTFNYTALTLNATTIGPCDRLSVSVTVTNTGAMAGDEIVQLYVKQPDASVPVPRVRLGDFARVSLEAGASALVTLVLEPKYHSIVPEGTHFFNPTLLVEQGQFEVYVGGGQPDYVSVLSAVVMVSNSSDVSTC
ncbi:uncharacterized protein MONBRDRAFT_28325 [Monosiga brevicollis MX1]|uniref:Fibronectin type III-like domain-containing protein n=1 Tax=Monosiga brevicollis TaxID=81824 RepID=A9V7U6_MONBE|nr:uncharacterized protein MONBRDRAFT_28325 [Monosiga brevicollis MX1]EDQ86438.1 predicted protein [Monosiga brevicollis MX1]|eukprot:XP_001748828.1 hypothetical protein [Monosiga brevicollis MX1]